jgi:predicted ATPase/DNA-binding winged helix-turn-helix (wHTH) protein
VKRELSHPNETNLVRRSEATQAAPLAGTGENVGSTHPVFQSPTARYETLSFGPFRLVPARQLLLEGDRPLRVGHRALAILQILAERAGQVVPKNELVRLVWPNTFVDDANIRVHIAALRRVLGDEPNGIRYIVNEPGRGYCFAVPVIRTTAPAQVIRDSLKRVRPLNSTLPNCISRLIGRDDAVAKFQSELTRERMVTIVGSGGIGKTSLALVGAPSWLSDSGYEIYFVDLALVANPAGVPAAVASAISTTTLHEDVVGSMLSELQDRHVLVILDNCEHVISAAASLCEALLTGTKNVKVLATSREALRIPGEWIHRLAPLRTPTTSEKISVAEAMAYPSVQLFVERATANVDTYEFRDEDAPSVINICRRLGGVPLAIEFAAARVDLLDIATIAERLNDRFALLTKGHRNALPRQQTLRAVLDWSCELLSTDRKIVLRRLSVFAGAFGVDDAIVVVSGDTIPRLTVLESLSDLVAKSILIADFSGPTVLYRLLETTQMYAHEQLAAAGEAETIRLRHAKHFLDVCLASAATDDGQRSARRAMADVRAGLDWALVSGGDITLGIELASAATPIFLGFALLREHSNYLKLALAHLMAGDTETGTKVALRVEMALRTAVALALYYVEGSDATAEHHLLKARAIALKIGDTTYELRTLWHLYGIAGNCGNYRKELAYAEMYDVTARTSMDAMAEPRRLRMLARSFGDVGRIPSARESLEFALRTKRASVPVFPLNAYEIDDWIAARAGLARILWLQGFPDDAKREADQCLLEALQLGHDQTTCWALAFHICPIAIWRGELTDATSYANILIKHSQRVFEHYHEWGGLYREFLNAVTLSPAEHGNGPNAAVIPRIPAQVDLFATFDARLIGDDALARVEADEEIWCAPEILRGWAQRLIGGDQEAAPADIEATLVRSLEIARRQESKAWELRTATTLAAFYGSLGRVRDARSTLEPVLRHFKPSKGSRDVQAAVRVQSELSA